MSHPSFAELDHRVWPLPPGSWWWAQVWEDLAFLHWPVPAQELQSRIPVGLEVEEFDGTAWIGVVPFRLRIRARGLPALPKIGAFPEINVRTYVRTGGRPGVWFFSLDAPSRFAIWAARWLYNLPYSRSRFEVKSGGDGVTYRCERLDSAASARFSGRYRPTGPVAPASPGTLDHFLTERYCLYAADSGGGLHRGEIHHAPWPLAPAEAEIEENTMVAPFGLTLEGSPRVAFSRRIEVATWPLRSLAR